MWSNTLVSSHLYDTQTNARNAAQVACRTFGVLIVTAGVQWSCSLRVTCHEVSGEE